MRYKVVFSVLGKKYRTEVEAQSIEQAKAMVKDRIKIISAYPVEDDVDVSYLKNLFGMN